MSDKIVRLDVREDIRQGREPFSRIMQTVAALAPDQALLLLAPFEPLPLFGMLAQQGLSHQSRELENGDFEVLFSRSGAGSKPAAAPKSPRPPAAKAAASEPRTLEVDARGLEPPQPLVTILEAVAALPAGARLKARTDRRPMHLYAQLEERGFHGQSEEQQDGSFITYIERR